MAFVAGPQVSPAPRTGQAPLDLMEGLTAAQAASLVPFVKLVQLDPRTGREVTGLRPLMYDLVQTPQFGAMGGFGSDPDAFRERGLVSLLSLRVQTQMEYGFISYSKINLEFMVHQPRLVLDRGSDVQWRALLEEGTAFSLEYGWRSDSNIVHDNPVFNGEGFEDLDTGHVIRPTRIMMLAVVRYNLKLQGNGEVGVSIEALENGDIALRETRLVDVLDDRGTYAERSRAPRVIPEDEARAANFLKSRLDGLGHPKDKFFTMGQLLRDLLYPMIVVATKKYGYDVVDMFVGNFNADAGVQSKEYGGERMAGRSIVDFKIPVARAKGLMADRPTKGTSLRIHGILSTLLGEINSFVSPWASAAELKQRGITDKFSLDGRPTVALQARTVRRDGKVHLVLTILDRKEKEHELRGLTRIPIEKQSRANIFDQLIDKNIPIIELGRAGSLILEASFEVQPDPLFQSILVDRAYKDRHEKEQITNEPDFETRKGLSRPQEVIPLSILEGTITFLGNFIFETYGAAWIEFFNSETISGIYHVLERTDTIEPGRFNTEVKFISEGIDPLNTRRKLEGQALADVQAAEAAVRGPRS